MMNNMNNFAMNPMGFNPIPINNMGMINMNNFAMNVMGFNPIPINNMGMIDMNGMNNMMNNMQNLNDENVLRIKNIIQPYENKIKELEEIIRQKDFEIAVLKDKLNNNNKAFNFRNQNFIILLR